MNKQELIAAVASEAGVNQEQTRLVINAFANVVTKAMVEGESVQLVGFGTFESKKYAAHTSRSVRTKEIIVIPESRKPVFKPSKILKDAFKK